MRDPEEVETALRRAHEAAVNGITDKPVTLYKLAADTIGSMRKQLADAREEIRDKSHDARKRDERASWARLVPESVLYPHSFSLLGTDTGAGFAGRLADGKIYKRNFDGLLQPIPGEVYRQDDTGKAFLVLACEVHLTHAVAHVTEYAGPIPEPENECGDYPAPCNHDPAHER